MIWNSVKLICVNDLDGIAEGVTKLDLAPLFPQVTSIRLKKNENKSHCQAFVDCGALTFQQFVDLKKSVDGTIVCLFSFF